MTSSHPLEGVSLTIRNFKSFGEGGGSYGEVKPINIIIGRNNTGKSALIDAIDICITRCNSFVPNLHARLGPPLAIEIGQALDEISLRQVFPEGARGGPISGDHWHRGQGLIGQTLVREFGSSWQPKVVSIPHLHFVPEHAQKQYVERIIKTIGHPFDGLKTLRVAAERDVRPEKKDIDLALESNGSGTTNLIRAFINSVNFEREEVERELLEELNTVYKGDSLFTRIACQEDDEKGTWEIFLSEETKGDIPLSQSGSSLKSVFIILSVLRLVPIVQAIDWSKVVLAVEEPENNLHPALLRRLLDFLAAARSEKRFTLIVTTHSPTAIDWSSRRPDSQIIHVKHDGRAAASKSAIGYLQGRDILDDLDIRASDMLQANGVIWVEGPSDRIYVRRWIELVSQGQIREDVHYTVMFYGGKLLSRLSLKSPDEVKESISLLRINRNAAVIIDSDRYRKKEGNRKPRLNLNKTKQRIKAEVESVDGLVWITAGREIENYTPVSVYERIAGQTAPKTIDAYTKMPEHPFLKEFKKNKINIAHAVASEVNATDLHDHLDLWERVEELCALIRSWNKLN